MDKNLQVAIKPQHDKDQPGSIWGMCGVDAAGQPTGSNVDNETKTRTNQWISICIQHFFSYKNLYVKVNFSAGSSFSLTSTLMISTVTYSQL